jgi:hypothetical protein
LTEQLGEHRRLRSDAPPAPSEDIHLPAPTYLPIIVAAGITIALVGILLNVLVFAFGMVVWIVAGLTWIRRAREEIAELPLDTG